MEIPYAVKYPILFLKGHPLTSLIVKQAHEHVCHNRVKEALVETRAKYWILTGRSFTVDLKDWTPLQGTTTTTAPRV